MPSHTYWSLQCWFIFFRPQRKSKGQASMRAFFLLTPIRMEYEGCIWHHLVQSRVFRCAKWWATARQSWKKSCFSPIMIFGTFWTTSQEQLGIYFEERGLKMLVTHHWSRPTPLKMLASSHFRFVCANINLNLPHMKVETCKTCLKV